MHPFLSRAGLALLSAMLLAAPVQAQTRLLRFPDIHGDQVVFTYGGDLWSAPVAGGTARQLDHSLHEKPRAKARHYISRSQATAASTPPRTPDI